MGFNEVAAVQVVTSAGVVMAGGQRILVHQFVWHPSAVDDDLLITDTAGNILYKVRAQGAAPNGESAYVCWQSLNAIVSGLNVVTMDGGTLYIFRG